MRKHRSSFAAARNNILRCPPLTSYGNLQAFTDRGTAACNEGVFCICCSKYKKSKATKCEINWTGAEHVLCGKSADSEKAHIILANRQC